MRLAEELIGSLSRAGYKLQRSSKYVDKLIDDSFKLENEIVVQKVCIENFMHESVKESKMPIS